MHSFKSLGRVGERVPCFAHRGKPVGRLPSHGAIDHAGELRWERGSQVAERSAREGSQEVFPFRHIRKRRIAASEVVKHGAPGKDVVGWTRRMSFILLARVERRRPGAQRFDAAFPVLVGDAEIDQSILPVGRFERVGRFEIPKNQTDLVQMRKRLAGCEPDRDNVPRIDSVLERVLFRQDLVERRAFDVFDCDVAVAVQLEAIIEAREKRVARVARENVLLVGCPIVRVATPLIEPDIVPSLLEETDAGRLAETSIARKTPPRGLCLRASQTR